MPSSLQSVSPATVSKRTNTEMSLC
jgi:hypothetical protein